MQIIKEEPYLFIKQIILIWIKIFFLIIQFIIIQLLGYFKKGLECFYLREEVFI